MNDPTDNDESSTTKQEDIEHDFTKQRIIKVKDGEYSTVNIDDDGAPVLDTTRDYVCISKV